MQSNMWFASCDEVLQTALLDLARIRHLEADEVVFSHQARTDGLYCLLAGGLRIYAAPPEGSLLLMAHAASYDWGGELPLIDDMPQGIMIVASSATTLAHVPRDLIMEWLDQHPKHWRDIARLLALRYRLVAELLRCATDLSLEERIVKRLTVMVSGNGMKSVPGRRVTCSQDELAAMVGASRPSISLALTKLAQRGLISVGYGEIVLNSDEFFDKNTLPFYFYRNQHDLDQREQTLPGGPPPQQIV
jgi:CRP-like cAMP-binding protein